MELYWLRYAALQSRLVRLLFEKTLFSYTRWKYSPLAARPPADAKPPYVIGIIGAGRHCQKILLPALARLDTFRIKKICTRTGSSAAAAEKQTGIEATTDYRDIINDDEIGAVVIAARSSLHMPFTLSSVLAGKYVMCEAPGITLPADIRRLREHHDLIRGRVVYGYHYFHCPLYLELKRIVAGLPSPKAVTMQFPARYHLYSLALMLNGRIDRVRCIKKSGEFSRWFEGTFVNGDRVIFETTDGADQQLDSETVEITAGPVTVKALQGKRIIIAEKGSRKEPGSAGTGPCPAGRQVYSCQFDGNNIQEESSLVHRGYIPELKALASLMAGQAADISGIDIVADAYCLNWALFKSLNTRAAVKVEYV